MLRRALTAVTGGLAVLTLVAGCYYHPAKSGGAGATPTAASGAHGPRADLPSDGCSIIPAPLLDQLVPFGKVTNSKRQDVGTFAQMLSCETSTDYQKANTTANGRLSLRIDRRSEQYGSIGEKSNRDSFNHQRDFAGELQKATPEKVEGLGDDAYLIATVYEEQSKTYRVELGILRYMDTIEITYTAEPSALDKARDAIKALGTFLVDTIATKKPETPTVAPFEASQARVPQADLKANVPQVTIVGPIWQPADATYTMKLNDIPFAFRAPKSWNCFKDSKTPTGEGTSHGCGAPNSESPQPARMRVFVRPCPPGCPADARAKLDTGWLSGGDKVPTLKAFDANTSWAQETSGGMYGVFLTHYFGDAAGDPIRWQVTYVGQAGATQAAQIAALQKVLNDIRTQTP